MNLLELRKTMGVNAREMAKLLIIPYRRYKGIEDGKCEPMERERELIEAIIKKIEKGERVWEPEPSNEPLASTTSKQVKFADGWYTIYTTTIYVKHS